jgi:hypothetical protein
LPLENRAGEDCAFRRVGVAVGHAQIFGHEFFDLALPHNGMNAGQDILDFRAVRSRVHAQCAADAARDA